jgi:hypothetical protein
MEETNEISLLTHEINLDEVSSRVLPLPVRDIKLDTKELSKNLKQFLGSLKPVIEIQKDPVGEFQVSEIELSIAVNASGGVSLIGQFNAGIEGGIKIKLTRTGK